MQCSFNQQFCHKLKEKKENKTRNNNNYNSSNNCISFCFLCLQLAILSGHFELGEIIKNHKDSDIGKLSHQTVSSEGAIKCFNEFPTSAFLYTFLNLSCICPYNLPSFSLTIDLISPSISPCHIKPHCPSSLLAPSYSSPLNPHP